MDLKVIEPITEPLKVFNTTAEFKTFYAENKEEIDKQTTHILNKKYVIDGYRITKIKGAVMLKKWNGKSYYIKKDNAPSDLSLILGQLGQQADDIASMQGLIDNQEYDISALQEEVIAMDNKLNTPQEIPNHDKEIQVLQTQFKRFQNDLSALQKCLNEIMSALEEVNIIQVK
jgi:peptidoglycan hydrolase CwlO-like protein